MGRRLLRVNEAIKEVVSSVTAGELTDPRLGFVTVTGVKTSPDLRYAKVFVSVLGPAAQREDSLAALRAAHGVIQARLAAQVRLKRTPQLEFVYDDTTDHAMRISGFLDDYFKEHPEPPLDPNAPVEEEATAAEGEESSADAAGEEPAAGAPGDTPGREEPAGEKAAAVDDDLFKPGKAPEDKQ